MRPQKLDYFDDWLKRKLRNPKFHEGYEEARLAIRLGYQIYQLRTKQGLTQARLARTMGTKQQAIARLEKGDYEGFTLKTLLKIAEATKTHLVVDFRPSTGRVKVAT